jgi:copper(I)-binding protein
MPLRVLALVLSLVAAVAACGGAGAGTPSASLAVSDAWMRPAAAGGVSAAYLTIGNPGSAADALVGVTATDVTDRASLHETSTDDGMTGMQHTATLAIPAGGTVVLAPGGYHVMLMDLKRDLAPGDRVDLTLAFEQAGPVTVRAEVRGG